VSSRHQKRCVQADGRERKSKFRGGPCKIDKKRAVDMEILGLFRQSAHRTYYTAQHPRVPRIKNDRVYATIRRSSRKKKVSRKAYQKDRQDLDNVRFKNASKENRAALVSAEHRSS
jgi:hypothetical protein